MAQRSAREDRFLVQRQAFTPGEKRRESVSVRKSLPTRTWLKPFSYKSPIQGGTTLECVAMEGRGLFKLTLVEPLVAHHLHPGQKALSTSSAPSFLSKTEGFQSSMTNKAYKSVALGVRALNASSMSMAYQAELQDEMSGSGDIDRKLWDEMCVVTDRCLHLHRRRERVGSIYPASLTARKSSS